MIFNDTKERIFGRKVNKQFLKKNAFFGLKFGKTSTVFDEYRFEMHTIKSSFARKLTWLFCMR